MKDMICFTKMKNGKRCLALSNDGSGKCGRHGGLGKITVKVLNDNGYEPNGDRIMRKASISKKSPIKKRKSRDLDGDFIMRKNSR